MRSALPTPVSLPGLSSSAATATKCRSVTDAAHLLLCNVVLRHIGVKCVAQVALSASPDCARVANVGVVFFEAGDLSVDRAKNLVESVDRRCDAPDQRLLLLAVRVCGSA